MDYKIKQGENYLYLNSQNGARALVSAEQSVKLCGEDTITIKVHSAQPITFNLGDTFDCFGTTYTLNQVPSCVINAPNNLDYTLVFEGLQYRLIDKIFLMPANTKGDNIMLTLSGFMAVLLDNANRGNNGKQYVLGNCPTTEAKNLNFSDKNCLSALQMLVTEYETEYKFVETAQNIRIDIGAVGTTFAYPIKYGVGGGAYELQRTKGTDIVTRLFVYGGTQNLTYYRHDRLCLPSKARTESYIEDSDKIATYGIKEAVKNFDDIYPNRIGAVSSITGCAYNEFIDSSMNFDLNAKWGENDVEEWLALRGLEDTSANRAIYNSDVKNKATKYLMPNETAKIHFNSGNLAGYECDINKYDASTKKFTLVPLVDENGYDFPSKTHSAFKIGVNDTYVILGINLPTEYKEDAEEELEEKATEYYNQVSNPQYKYSLSIAPLILKRMENNVERDTFKVGDYIHVIDEANNVNADIRIDSFTRDLLNPFDYKLQLSDDLVVNQQVRQLIDSKQIKTIVEKSPIADVNYLRRSYKSVEELQAMIFDTEGQIYGEKIQPLSIDTTMLKVGARSQQYTLKNVLFTPNNEGNPAKLVITAGTLEHYTIAEPDVAVWNLSAYVNNSLPTTAQYVYAQCSRANNTANFLVTGTQHKFDEGSTYYYFLIGTLSSVDTQSNTRTISLTYGFSTINGQFIKTGRISSNDGQTYFDLNSGEIKGNIKLTAGDSDNASIINALVDSNSTVATASANASSAVSTAQTANSTANAVNTRVNNLSGRNYMRNTGYMTASTPPTLDGGTPTNLGVALWGNGSEFQVSNTIVTTASIEYVKYAFFNGDYNGARGLGGLVAGKTYTLSFDIRGNVAGGVAVEGQFYAGGAWVSYLGGDTQPTSQSAWSTKKIKIDIPANATSVYIELRMRGVTYTGQWVNLRNVKLEEGEVVTPWSIAPEDTQAGIDLANLEGTCDCAHTLPTGNSFTVECNQFKSSYLKKGTRIKITMALENHNSYRGTFNVNGTGAKNLLWQKSTDKNPIWDAGEVVPFIYNGSQWVIEDEEQRILKQVYSEATSGATDIRGGLIITKLLQCGEGSTQAGISGLSSSIVAFWAGGSHAQASAFDTPVVIMRDGNAKFGLMRINSQGSITVPNADGYSRLNIFDGNLPNPTSSAIKIDTRIHSSGTTASGSSSTLYVSGSTLSANYNGQVANANPYTTGAMLKMSLTASQRASIQFYISLKCGSNEEYIVTHNDYVDYDSSYTYYRIKPTSCAYKHDSGSANISVTLKIVGGVSGNINWSLEDSGIQLEFNGDTTVPKTNLASNGLQVLLNASNYFEAKQVGSDLITTIRGKIKAPGLLLAGKIASGGGFEKKYACEGVSCYGSVSDTSLYTITISGVNSEPAVTTTPFIQGISGRGWSAMVSSISLSGTTATIKIRTTSDNTNTACAFYFAVYGEPA